MPLVTLGEFFANTHFLCTLHSFHDALAFLLELTAKCEKRWFFLCYILSTKLCAFGDVYFDCGDGFRFEFHALVCISVRGNQICVFWTAQYGYTF